jgi:hypothetical protein
MAGKGFVELGEPVEEFPSDNGFGIQRYPPHFAERREVGCLVGMGLHLASVGRRPRRVRRKNRLAGTEKVTSQATFGMTSELGRVRTHPGPGRRSVDGEDAQLQRRTGASSPVPGAT